MKHITKKELNMLSRGELIFVLDSPEPDNRYMTREDVRWLWKYQLKHMDIVKITTNLRWIIKKLRYDLKHQKTSGYLIATNKENAIKWGAK